MDYRFSHKGSVNIVPPASIQTLLELSRGHSKSPVDKLMAPLSGDITLTKNIHGHKKNRAWDFLHRN